MLGHRKLNVEEYFDILKRRWWIIAIPAVLIALLAYGATFFITPKYVSSSLVLIDQQKVPTDVVKPLATEALDTTLAYINEKIVSRTSILPIIERYNLYADPHLSTDERIALTRKALHTAAVQSQLAQSNGLPGFTISFTASDPHTAQQVCAEITSEFTKENVAFRNGQAEDTNGFLQERLDDAKRALDAQDQKVAAFQRQFMGMLPDDVGSNVGIMDSLNSRLDATTQAIQSLEQNKSVGEAMLAQQVQPSSATVAAKALAPHQAELEQLQATKASLLSQYQPDYPDVRDVERKIQDLKAQMAHDASAPQVSSQTAAATPHVESAGTIALRAQLRGIDVQLAAKQREQDELKRQIQGYAGKIQASPQVAEEFKEMTRDYQTDQEMYNNLRQEMNQAQMTTDLEHRQEGETFSLLDAANLPVNPIFPNVPVFTLGGLAVGIGLGVAIIALLEYKDTALRTERDIWDFTHLPTLAVIAWSGETAEGSTPRKGRLKRLFRRKPDEDALAGAQG